MQPPDGTSLPAELFDLIEFTPLEDLVLALIRDGLPDGIQVASLIGGGQMFPLVLVRRTPSFGRWDGDARFIDTGQLSIHAYCTGVEADSDAAFLSEAVRVVLRDSVNKTVPNYGYLTAVEMVNAPRRVPDWATAQGPVQYADLPTGVLRYETVYDCTMRRPK